MDAGTPDWGRSKNKAAGSSSSIHVVFPMFDTQGERERVRFLRNCDVLWNTNYQIYEHTVKSKLHRSSINIEKYTLNAESVKIVETNYPESIISFAIPTQYPTAKWWPLSPLGGAFACRHPRLSAPEREEIICIEKEKNRSLVVFFFLGIVA